MRVRSRARSKNSNIGMAVRTHRSRTRNMSHLWSWIKLFNDSKFASKPTQVLRKESKLPEENTNQEHGNWPDQCNNEDIHQRPLPSVFNLQPIHDYFSQKPCYTSADGKYTKNQKKLPAIHIPFRLKPFKHANKSAANFRDDDFNSSNINSHFREWQKDDRALKFHSIKFIKPLKAALDAG